MSDSQKMPDKNRGDRKAAQGDSAEDQSVMKSGLMRSEKSPDSDNTIYVDSGKKKESVGTDSDGTNRLAKDEDDTANQSLKAPAKKEIKNLAEYIVYAYSRKGQRLSLKPKVEKAICNSPRLDGEARGRLLELAKEDVLLAVPRQILLAVRNITGYPVIKSEVRDFVSEVLSGHPVFSIPELEGVINNLDHGSDPRSALVALAEADYSKLPGLVREKPLKPKDYETLRVNATYCLAVWFTEARNLSLEKLNQYLFTALWQPHAQVAKDDTRRLQMLTDIHDLSGVGLACLGFKQESDRQMRVADAAKRAEESALERLQSLRLSYAELQRELEDRIEEVSKFRDALQAEKQSHENTRTHLGDDIEHLRSRLLRRLKAEVSLLNEGLHALRREPPKIRVMEDHAERVLEGLKKEIEELSSNE